MNIKKWLVSLAAVFSMAAVRAQPLMRTQPVDRFSLVFETRSYHFEEGYNNFNPGIGFEYRLNNTFHIGAGGYYNSLERFSGYALAGAETSGKRFFGVGAEAGIVTGYDWAVTPAAMPYVRLGSRESRVNAKIDVMPPIPGVTPALVTLQLRVKLGKTGPLFVQPRHCHHHHR